MFKNIRILLLTIVLLVVGFAMAAPLLAQGPGAVAVADSLANTPIDVLDGLSQFGWFQWILINIGPIVVVLYVLDKLVKLTPTPADDFVVSFLLAIGRKLKRLRR